MWRENVSIFKVLVSWFWYCIDIYKTRASLVKMIF